MDIIMIVANGLTKNFDGFTALDKFTADIPRGSIYGLVGTNGSGKSTLLRLISGIYKPDGGSVEVEGEAPFENIAVKSRIFLVADDLYFLPQSSMDDMAAFYAAFYPSFDRDVYREICSRFPLDPRKRINTFSKGMKRQAALVLSLACRPEFLLLDEAFDGLDPVIRGALRKLLADLIADGGMSVVIASHNLRELEDLCDHMGLLHAGKVVFAREIDEVKLGFCKVQAAFSTPPDEQRLSELDIMQRQSSGSVLSLVVRGSSGDVLRVIEDMNPVFAEAVSLTLEEVFIHEMEAIGYDYNKILF